jgi:prepilin-type N-terminal cleavage/methylation domain-containing protein
MNRGFSLVELVVALLIFQIGLLATAGMVFLAQRSLLRAELTVRATLASDLVADSLEEVGEVSAGRREYAWGEITWTPASDAIGGLFVLASSALLGDTLVTLRALIPEEDSVMNGGGLRTDGGNL